MQRPVSWISLGCNDHNKILLKQDGFLPNVTCVSYMLHNLIDSYVANSYCKMLKIKDTYSYAGWYVYCILSVNSHGCYKFQVQIGAATN